VSSFAPVFGSDRARVWLAGAIGAPPHEAKVGDCWWPEDDPHCYVLTAAGWTVDSDATTAMLRSLSSPTSA